MNPLLVERFGKLETFLQKNVFSTAETERTNLIWTIHRNERYWQGNHYGYPRLTNNRTIEWSNATGNLLGGYGDKKRRGLYDYVLNYYYGDGLKLVGVLGRVPNAKSVADDSDNPAHGRRAQKGDRIIRELWSHWDVETQQSELILSLFKNTTTFGYTPFVADSDSYGQTSVPQIEMRMAKLQDGFYRCKFCATYHNENDVNAEAGSCPGCGQMMGQEDYYEPQYGEVPEIVNSVPFPNGSVEFHLCTPYTVTTPFFIKELKQSGYLTYEYEEMPGALMRTYRHLNLRARRREFQGGNASSSASEYASEARATAAVPSGEYNQSERYRMWRYTRTWITPAMYEEMAEDDEQLAELLYETAKDGAKLTLINGKILEIEAEKLTEVWAECKPTVGEYIYTKGLGDNYIRANDLINNNFNIMAQTAQNGIPKNFYDPNILDANVFNENPTTVGEYIPVVPGSTGRLRDAIYETKPAELNPVSIQVGQTALSAAREIVGVTPPLFGAEQVERQTLGEAELKRNQALMPHNTTWNFVRRFWSKCFENGVTQFAKYSAMGSLYFRGGQNMPPKKLEIEDIQELLEGGWHVDCDETIPMTWGQKRAQTWRIIESGPPVWDLFGMKHPVNVQAMQDSIGMSDLEIPGFKERLHVLATIELLVKDRPIQQPSMDPMAQPMLLPSIPIGTVEDDHELQIQVAKEWCQDEDQGGWHRKYNPAGYQNVIAWMWAHLRYLQSIAAPPMPPGGGAPGPQGAGPQQQIAAPMPEASRIQNPPPSGSPVVSPAEPPPRPEETGAPVLEGV